MLTVPSLSWQIFKDGEFQTLSISDTPSQKNTTYFSPHFKFGYFAEEHRGRDESQGHYLGNKEIHVIESFRDRTDVILNCNCLMLQMPDIHRGNSGGPVLDRQGKAIGLISALEKGEIVAVSPLSTNIIANTLKSKPVALPQKKKADDHIILPPIVSQY